MGWLIIRDLFFTKSLEYLNKIAVICDPKFKEHVEDVSDNR